MSPPPPPLAPALAIQGGAGAYQSIDDGVISKEDYSQGVLAALRIGYQILLDGGSAVTAVVEATKAMEDNPVFNSGTCQRVGVVVKHTYTLKVHF